MYWKMTGAYWIDMNFLEVIGFLTVTIITVKITHSLFRYFFPKKYTYENCPADHDTMSRYGARRCDTCGSKMYSDDEDELNN
jgi:hypothetical protein